MKSQSEDSLRGRLSHIQRIKEAIFFKDILANLLEEEQAILAELTRRGCQP